MKKLILTIAIILTSSSLLNASNHIQKNYDEIPRWYECELIAEAQATNDGYVFNTMSWYEARNNYREDCLAEPK
ncbi:MAG TPA: hypothetical protein ENK64_03055 [Flavobacteriales bacterium]|jgi:hypothetical protein|nr:hypothetical protein [Flavobacteriales bacterium]